MFFGANIHSSDNTSIPKFLRTQFETEEEKQANMQVYAIEQLSYEGAFPAARFLFFIFLSFVCVSVSVCVCVSVSTKLCVGCITISRHRNTQRDILKKNMHEFATDCQRMTVIGIIMDFH